ncbi:hypothetical protein LTR78_002763 [Recurvomyces mirabilis]|uniref:Uncharacterized protein n=1 Tax=Recurvomyces mirabilis TaxID=574656 RepID=A0AAE0WSZ1_9PEZI|nr:hypothetical protein LTR78_002763 [Recurvomyces mirabilis]KAK5159503.1 hypothetical protein LTS14_002645 [Recurvomyces mirabilis]
MAHTNVSSCVLSIIASFSSGLDVFKKLHDKRKRKKRSSSKIPAQLNDEEVRLVRSLRRGPEDIGREYILQSQRSGKYFAVGDATAQTSLAEILLKLNFGLVSIITSFLSRDKKHVQLDYQSLTSLSERSRLDTCHALRLLFERLAHPRLPLAHPRLALPGNAEPLAGCKSDVEKTRKRRRANAAHTRVNGPMLARVVIANSSKPSQIAMVKPGERRAKASKQKSKSNSAAAQSVASLPSTSPPPYLDVDDKPPMPARPTHQRSQTAPEEAMGTYQEGQVFKSAAGQRSGHPASVPTTNHHQYLDVKRRPVASHSAVELAAAVPRRRKQTPTYYSIASDRTKLGEIPMEKWPEAFDFDAMSLMNRQAEINGWPVNQMGSEVRKKRFGLMRLFRRKEVGA